MHQLALDEILKDAVAHRRHNASANILDKWTKAQLAEALDDMVLRLKICKDALRGDREHGPGR